MNSLPSGVEASLLEAGFSPTEIVILKRLLDDKALTLREVAARTGKSTGVLDQAMKKLLRKGIVTREVINDTVKYTMVSLDAVLHWMEDDVRKKQQMLTRRHQNFESFIRTLEEDKRRPHIEYFDGLDGMAQAYRRLLDCGPELLMYEPVFCPIENDPLRDFKVEWFRGRRKKGIFSRVIAHNTPLGRRHQSRDPFEYRQTILVDEEDYPFTFEKIICGGTIACFNYVEKRSCLLHYPELAAMERTLFDAVWKQGTRKEPADASSQEPAIPPVSESPVVPLSTRALSGLREFFLSPKSFAAFCGIAVLSAVITFYLYDYTKKLQFGQMQETVKSIAITGSFQFDPKDLDALRVEQDWKKPEWSKVVKLLEQIRIHNDDIVFVYVIRKKKLNPEMMEFIADSHSIYPYANTDSDKANDVDANGDGKIEPNGPDKLQWPGQEYPTAPQEAFLAYDQPLANEEIYEDSYGRFITGYASVKDKNGKVAAVLAVDMKAKLLDERVATMFKPFLFFLGLFILFVFIRLTAFNRSLFLELWKASQIRRILITLAFSTGFAFLITLGLYQYMLQQTINETGGRLMSVVATAAPEFDPRDLDALHVAEDMKKAEYQRVFRRLNQIRETNSEIKFIYVMRLIDGSSFEFVADADSNYDLPGIGPDFNNDGVLDKADENVAPGVQYNDKGEMRKGFEHPHFERSFYTDQWGTWISGFAPIKGTKNSTLIGADVDVSDVKDALQKKFSSVLWFTGILSILLIFLQLLLVQNRKKEKFF